MLQAKMGSILILEVLGETARQFELNRLYSLMNKAVRPRLRNKVSIFSKIEIA